MSMNEREAEILRQAMDAPGGTTVANGKGCYEVDFVLPETQSEKARPEHWAAKEDEYLFDDLSD